MSDVKNAKEQEYIDIFLRNITALKDSSDEEINKIMQYGIDKINRKTVEEFEEEFIQQLEQDYDFFNNKFISKVLNKIKIEESQV